MENHDNIHIVIASDNNYAFLVSILLTSIFKNNPNVNCITINLLANNIDSNNIQIIKSHIPKDKGELIIYDLSDIRNRLNINIPNTISISSYSRLFISSILSKDIDKVIYMDVDAIVNKPLMDLWSTSIISNNYIAGVLDDVSSHAKMAIGLSQIEPYINAGLLLINLKKWREDYIERKFIDFLHSHNGNVYHHDQGIINAVCRGKIAILPPQFNMVTNFFVQRYNTFLHITPFYTQTDIEIAKLNPVYIHFTASVAGRPWLKNCKHPLLHLFLKYKDLTSYKNIPLKKDTSPFKLKLLSFIFYNAKPLYYFILKIRSAIKE